MSATPVEMPGSIVLVGGGNMIAGKEIMMLVLARGLREAGVRVEFITSLWGGKGEFVSRLDAEGFKYYRARLGFISLSMSWKPFIWTLDQLRYWPSLVIGYLNAIRAAAPNAVVHTNWHHAMLLLPFLDRHRDIYWSHEIVPDKWHYGVVFRAIAERVALIVCVSHAAARSLVNLGIEPERIVVIHNGIPELSSAFSDADSVRTCICVGIAGQIGAWKGHDDLVDAFARLARTHETLILKIVGNCEGEFAIALKGRIAALGLERRVVSAGFVNDRKLIYADMDICVVPSRSEDPLPTTAIEAGFCGLPVVATATGGLPEIVEDGVTGLLVPVATPHELADAIDRLVRSPDLRRRMGANARARMRRLFSEQRFIQDFSHRILGDVRLRLQKKPMPAQR